MSIFSELLPKIKEISNAYTKNFNDELKAILDSFDKFEEDYLNGRNRAREKAHIDKKLMTTLQSINEDEDDQAKSPENDRVNVAEVDKPKGVSKKRCKDEVDGTSSPEQADKRTKRNASVKAQNNISKQVNMNLVHKMRRDDILDKNKNVQNGHEEDKENAEPSIIHVKQEKPSLPPETMDVESLPLDINVKKEQNQDEISMPPPFATVPKTRRAKEAQKDKSDDNSEDDLSTTKNKRTTRTKKQTDMPPPAPRATRASSRASAKKQQEDEIQPTAEARPKRTRGKKKVSDTTASINESTQAPTENAIGSPAEKPRPKRTRKAQKAAEKPIEVPQIESKQERLSEPEITSPILNTIPIQYNTNTKTNLKTNAAKSITQQQFDVTDCINLSNINNNADETKIIKVEPTVNALDETRIISKHKDGDTTVVLSNGVCNLEATDRKQALNETVVIEKQKVAIDSTFVLDKVTETKAANLTEDNSLLTDDNDDEPRTPPKKDALTTQPPSAVKEKVQQFEELASRVTRTKTRAMAKQEEQTDNVTPPDKINKAILDADTLTKMNRLIFNGTSSHGQISLSACKPRTNIPTLKTGPSTTSKLSSISKHKEAAEENMMGKEQDARKKKEAMLEAKREMQKRKREEKMAAAAAARLAADRERAAAAAAAEREREDRLAALRAAQLERRRDLQRKKQESARKVAETEERRRAEEQQRLQRLAEEQKRAELARKKQLEEQENMKKEAALMAKEIENKQRMYIEKQKLKQYQESKGHTPLKTFGTPSPMSQLEPVYMQDGFQYLNSDEEEKPVERVPPAWATSKARKAQLVIQSQLAGVHTDRLFSVRVHSPDLRAIFPAIDRARLKRTSSAVWRTPPRLPALAE